MQRPSGFKSVTSLWLYSQSGGRKWTELHRRLLLQRLHHATLRLAEEITNWPWRLIPTSEDPSKCGVLHPSRLTSIKSENVCREKKTLGVVSSENFGAHTIKRNSKKALQSLHLQHMGLQRYIQRTLEGWKVGSFLRGQIEVIRVRLGVDVMITIFCDDLSLFCEKIGVFLKNQCYDQLFAKTSCSLSKKRQYFR
jgi:hypothetical protein